MQQAHIQPTASCSMYFVSGCVRDPRELPTTQYISIMYILLSVQFVNGKSALLTSSIHLSYSDMRLPSCE